MPTPKKKPVKTKVRKSKTKNLVLYVEDCTLKGKVFKDGKSLGVWVKTFEEKCPPTEFRDDWIDLIVTNIKGEITPMDAALEIS